MIVSEVKHGELAEPPNVAGNFAGQHVAREIKDSKERQGGRDAAREGAGNGLPIGDRKSGELGEVADGRGDGTGHVAGAIDVPEDRVVEEAAKGDVDDAASGGVAADAVPAVATVGASPGTEEADAGLIQRSLEGHESRPFGRRAGLHEGAK